MPICGLLTSTPQPKWFGIKNITSCTRNGNWGCRRLPHHLVMSILCLWLIPQLHAQSGCTDPLALNYDPLAVVNDGSCEYAPASYSPLLIGPLDEGLAESSGLIATQEGLWSITDSGGLQKLYRLNKTTAATEHQTLIVSATNNDWEDLAADSNFLYIGDFGNNQGNRTDLRIYKIPRAQLNQTAATAEVIAFQYEDQTDFTPAYNQNNYDCEAFFFANDSLHLFTKRWLDFKTYHYVLPAEPGNHTAILRDSFSAQMLITAADIDPQGNIALLGVSPITQNASVWLLYDYPSGQFFKGNKRRINLGSPFETGQLEGICFEGPWQGYLCAENFGTLPPLLHRFDFNQLQTTAADELPSVAAAPRIYPQPFFDVLQLEWFTPFALRQIALFDSRGRLLQIWEGGPSPISSKTLDLNEALPSGIYFLHITDQQGRQAVMRVAKFTYLCP